MIKIKGGNGKSGKFFGKPGESVLDCAKRFDMEPDAPCEGEGICGKRRVASF
jgi:ferredoxin